MIVFIVLFNVQFPLNTAQILIDIMSLANLDLFEVDGYIIDMFKFKLKTKPFNEIFEAAGFESSTFTIELGMIFFIILFSVISILLKQILKLATMRCSKNWLTKRLRQPVNVMVIVVRFFMESCNELGLAALVTIKMADGDRWEHLAESIDLVFAYGALALLITTPFVLYYYGRRLIYRRLGMTEQEAEAITSLFDQYREDDIVGIRFTVIFFLRRFIMIAILTSLPS